ncbi:MAG: hypothetical protein GY854_32145 [Deltaproteobacteria bacterium]|nr:hypothetical protein [Deltaproteobacteria bacterium]
MYLEIVRKDLERQINTDETTRQLNSASKRHGILKRFDTASSLVAFLNTQGDKDISAQNSVILALIAEVQRREHPFASATILAAYFPGLLRIYREAGTVSRMGCEELEWLVLESFIDVVASFPVEMQGRYALINLVRSTRRTVLNTLRREGVRAQKESMCYVHDELYSEKTQSPEQLLSHWEIANVGKPAKIRKFMSEFCKSAFKGEPYKRDLQLLLDTMVKKKPLVEYLKERLPDAYPDEFLRKYTRIRKRRNRFLNKIQRRLSHCEGSSALFIREALS